MFSSLILALLFGLVVAAGVGFLAQWSGICMVRGVREWQAGRPALLLAIVLCGVWTWTTLPLGSWLGIDVPVRRYPVAPIFAVGGFIFGLGSALNQGCTVSTMSKLAQGNAHMLMTMLGWIVGWCAWMFFQPFTDTPMMTTVPRGATYALVGLSVTLTVWAFTTTPERRKLWLGVMAFGFLAGLLYLLEPHWSPSDMVLDLSSVVLGENSVPAPSPYRYALILMILLGMLLAAWRSHAFSLQKISGKKLALHLGGGTLMGVGASMSLGGNDAQLLIALPSFSPAGVLTVAFIIIGVLSGLWAQSRFFSTQS